MIHPRFSWGLAEDLDTEIIRPNGSSSVEQGVLSYSAAVQGTAVLCRSSLARVTASKVVLYCLKKAIQHMHSMSVSPNWVL